MPEGDHMALINVLFVLALIVLAVPAVLACGYLLLQTLMSAELPTPPASSRQLRFDIVVPAHNEALGIAHTIANLRQLDWPADRFRILVVADNCNDETAAIAKAAGAHVLERHDETQRGKGYALKFAFQRSKEEGWCDAIVIVDADSEVTPNMLEAFASRIERGAGVLQARYGVLNPWGSWRTRLLTVAIGAVDTLRSRARERWGVSSGLRGNGWCVTHKLLDEVNYNAFSLTEDLEYGVALGLAGHRVVYTTEAEAAQDMTPASPQAAQTQRRRWEMGRFRLLRSKTLPLLRAALQRRSLVCLDLAFDLLLLPLSYIALAVGALLVVAILATWWHLAFLPWVWLGVACILTLLLYVMRGWQLSGMGARGLLDLLGAPWFVLWKLLLMLRRNRSEGWVRTERKRS
jgi:cellulose synthase/poly-beta-1,6-N-acetylglucosamine synthase-like glycosyltransferase